MQIKILREPNIVFECATLAFKIVNHDSYRDRKSFYASKYQIEDGKISLVDKVMLVEPKYVVKNGTPVMEPENVILNNRIFVGEKYLYMTADPEKVSDMKEREKRAREEGRRESAAPGNDSYIVVFDYDLNFIKSFRVDSDVWHLALTPDPSVVYASDYRENRLKKYVLADLK